MTTPPKPPPKRPVREALDTKPGALRHTVLRMLVTALLLLLIYSVIPLATKSGATAVVALCVGLVVFLALIVRQVRKIMEAEHPKLRAVEAGALIVPVLVLVFAYTYVSISDASPGSFSEPISRVDGVYFAMTTLSTVGFGDIVAKSEGTRVIVTIQILCGLIAAVGLARLLFGAADLGLSSRQSHDDRPQPPADV